MFASPESLQDICVDIILRYIEPQVENKDNWEEKVEDGVPEDEVGRFRFRDPDVFLINQISEKLLEKMVKRRLLGDATFNIFSGKNTKLRKLTLTNCKLSKDALKIIKEHNITHLECAHVRISIGDILDSLNEWSMENVVHANFSNCTFINKLRYSFMVEIAKLKNLKSLNLAYTELNQSMFRIICEDLVHLEKLDISGTQVTDLRPLTMLSSTLTSLTLCDLHRAEYLLPTIEQLQLLQYLDVSVFSEKMNSRSYYHCCNPIVELLEIPHILPNLIGLDVSGCKFISKKTLFDFIETHPKLQFLGIVLCSVTFDPIFLDTSGVDLLQNLVIAGFGNEAQIKLTLKKYKDRYSYVQKALYHLFQITSAFREVQPDVFELVQEVMEIHKNKFGVQMAATACVYNLTRGELAKSIHPNVLSKGVNLTLEAMETFPEEFQLQKNSLLTLCSDRILQEISFNRYKCAELVLNALCQFEDVNMERMAVAICSILAAKVSTDETSRLGAHPKFMDKLLSMVRSRLETKTIDVTFKFTLSALWNLTDESADTCKVFLEKRGAELFLEVLMVFRGNLAIEPKVLGLLNNIAEVSELRESLMIDDLIHELYNLLKSENIEASYFAAGIIAHLACDGDAKWKVKTLSREEMLTELELAISEWEVPESEMVAYRSFKPFLPLLEVEKDYEVQLWAVWAIHHVCTKNSKRYCQMLQDENVYILLRKLARHQNTVRSVSYLCNKILNAPITEANV